MDLFNDIQKDALFSPCGKHRIWLSRIWDINKPMIMFIGLNPSKADHSEDDNTIKRVKKISNNSGYGGFYMMNLFTYISTDPKKLNIEQGNINLADRYLKHIASKCETIVFAWGNFKVFGRDKEVKQIFPLASALHINKNGSPQHPLFIKGNVKIIPFIQCQQQS